MWNKQMLEFKTLPESKIPNFVGFPSFDQSEIASNCFFHDIMASIKLPFLILRYK